MTEEQHETVVHIVSTLVAKMQLEVNRFITEATKKELLTLDQIDLIRTLLTEQARFWK